MKLRVENLARIKEAEVEVKNLTLFVGQNSTHKSYMAHVIYELYMYSSETDKLPISELNHFFKNVIKQVKNSLNINYLSNIVHINNKKNLKLAFSDAAILKFKKNDINLKEILLCIYDNIIDNFLISINNSFNSQHNILKKLFIIDEIIDEIMDKEEIELFYFQIDNIQDVDYLLNKVIFVVYSKVTDVMNENNVYYFPASRSGYTLGLEAIYAGMFSNSVRGKNNSSRLTEPTIDFIEEFYKIKNGTIPIANNVADDKIALIDFIQNNIIKGKIIEDINEFNYSNYYLAVEDKKIDLHLASSATLETLPFIVFLKNTKDITKTFFVIEEPEAHLHPKAQIQMAKFIVMLSNAGAKVLVTTHSDYILNEINNCIKLNSLKEKNEFSISKDDVSAYLFKNEENETTVKALTIDKFGIANDNFDEALEELLDLSNDLNERLIDNE